LIQVVILAAAAAVRAGLRSLLSCDPNLHVLFEVSSVAGLELMEEKPEILVVNLEENTLPALMDYLKQAPQVIPLFLVSGEDQIERLGLDRRLAIWGFLSFEAGAAEITAAIHALAQGLVVGNPTMINSLLKHPGSLHGDNHEGELTETLTPREMELLQLISRGLTNKQIAQTLTISEHTVKFHLSSIFSKLGVFNRTEAVRSGIHHGLITL
jgi:two-component system, NarL family, response regulator YdfI